MEPTIDIQSELKSKFEDLEFRQKSHSYYLYGERLPGASRIISSLSEKFDEQHHAARIAERDSKTVENVLSEWAYKRDESIRHGKFVHDFAEHVLTNVGFKDLEKLIGLMRFLGDFEITRCDILAVEQPVCSRKYKLAGTPDLLLEKDSISYMIDWKTNASLTKSFDFLYAPFDFLPASPLSKYYIQQNIYKLCLEEHGIYIDKMLLVHIQDGTYTLYEVPDFQSILHDNLHWILENITNTTK